VTDLRESALMRLFAKAIGAFMPRLIADVGRGTKVSGRIERRSAGGTVRIGCQSVIAGTLVTETGSSRLAIGDNVFIGGGSLIDCVGEITVESDVLISYQVIIMDSDNHSLRASERIEDLRRWREGRYDWSRVSSKPVHIHKKAWIGARSIISKGVEVGEGGVVAAGSVVTKSVEPYTIVAGNPARVVRELQEHER
jgi:acetyltransferase-like isoleucine patch superfamily enzyme